MDGRDSSIGFCILIWFIIKTRINIQILVEKFGRLVDIIENQGESSQIAVDKMDCN